MRLTNVSVNSRAPDASGVSVKVVGVVERVDGGEGISDERSDVSSSSILSENDVEALGGAIPRVWDVR